METGPVQSSLLATGITFAIVLIANLDFCRWQTMGTTDDRLQYCLSAIVKVCLQEGLVLDIAAVGGGGRPRDSQIL